MPMKLPGFELLSYELPPRSQELLCAPAHARIEIEGQEILLRVVRVEKRRYVVFLRREGENLILINATENWDVAIWGEPPKLRKLERIGRRACKKRSGMFYPVRFAVVTGEDGIGRPLLFNDRYPNIISKPPFTRCYWLHDDLTRGFHFDFKEEGDLWTSLQAEASDPFSTANIEWTAMHLPPKERTAFRTAIWKKARTERLQKQQPRAERGFVEFWKNLWNPKG